jgi:hypothetical protein
MPTGSLTSGQGGPPPLPPVVVEFTARELSDLARAKSLLENPGLPARIANAVGRPLEEGLKMLPSGWQNMVGKATRAALGKALVVAVSSLKRNSGKPRRASERWHKMMVGASGGVGGVFGFAALPIELPLSTTLMLRSIADIARSEGHDLARPEVQLGCLEVFAFGGPTKADDAAETSYWAVRAAMTKAVSEAAAYLGKRGAVDHAAPVMIRFIATVAARFGVIVSEEIAAKAIPVVGAAAGATINVVFIDHFQDMARGHFIVRRLEGKYGRERVRAVYESLATRM